MVPKDGTILNLIDENKCLYNEIFVITFQTVIDKATELKFEIVSTSYLMEVFIVFCYILPHNIC